MWWQRATRRRRLRWSWRPQKAEPKLLLSWDSTLKWRFLGFCFFLLVFVFLHLHFDGTSGDKGQRKSSYCLGTVCKLKWKLLEFSVLMHTNTMSAETISVSTKGIPILPIMILVAYTVSQMILQVTPQVMLYQTYKLMKDEQDSSEPSKELEDILGKLPKDMVSLVHYLFWKPMSLQTAVNF